jgi:hypothetical protein
MLRIRMKEVLHPLPHNAFVACTGTNLPSLILSTLKNPVKKISHLRRQDKKAPKFSHFIKITLLRNFPLKM